MTKRIDCHLELLGKTIPDLQRNLHDFLAIRVLTDKPFEDVFLFIWFCNRNEFNQVAIDCLIDIKTITVSKSWPEKLRLVFKAHRAGVVIKTPVRENINFTQFVTVLKISTLQHLTIDFRDSYVTNSDYSYSFVSILRLAKYPAYFSIFFAQKSLNTESLVSLAGTLQCKPELYINLNVVNGLQLNLMNTLNSENLIDQIIVAVAFARALNRANFPKYLSLNLNLDWKIDHRFSAPQLIYYAIASIDFRRLCFLNIKSIITGDVRIDLMIERHIQIASEIVCIQTESVPRIEITGPPDAPPIVVSPPPASVLLISLQQRNTRTFSAPDKRQAFLEAETTKLAQHRTLFETHIAECQQLIAQLHKGKAESEIFEQVLALGHSPTPTVSGIDPVETVVDDFLLS